MKKTLCILFLLLIAFPKIVFSEETSPPAPDFGQLMSKSGLQDEIDQISAEALASFNQQLFRNNSLTAEERSQMKMIVSDAFSTKALLAEAQDYTQKNLLSDEAAAIITWLDTPLGTKETALGKLTSDPDAQKQAIEFWQKFYDKTPDEGRVNLIQKLIEAMKITEHTLELHKNANIAIMDSMTRAMGYQSFSKIKILKEYNLAYPRLLEEGKKEMTMTGLFIYKDLTDGEINDCITFYSSSTGQKYGEVFTMALSSAMEKAAKNASHYLGKIMRKKLDKGDPRVTPSK